MSIDGAQKLTIVDPTIRESGYSGRLISPQESAPIIVALENAGVQMIETGLHQGIGMHRFETDNTDFDMLSMEYARIAASHIIDSRWGMVAMGPVVLREEMEELVRLGIGFLRIVGQYEWIDSMATTIALAKDAGVPWVSGNIANSGNGSIVEFVEAARKFRNAGADAVYVVDSNSMLAPTLVANYVAFAAETGLAVGFHGHNQTGFSAVNSLAAVKNGAAYVDGSMGGFGRNNTVLEQLLILLDREGVHHGVDLLAYMEATQQFISPIFPEMPDLGGMAGSITGVVGYTPAWAEKVALFDVAERHELNPYVLIAAIGDRSEFRFRMPTASEVAILAATL